MLISCWSAKGGSGTTVVAAAIALRLARTSRLARPRLGRPPAFAPSVSSSPATGSSVLLVDLAGDVPLVLGLGPAGESSPGRSPTLPGAADWLAGPADAPTAELDDLVVAARPGLGVLPRGAPLAPGDGGRLAGALADPARGVVVADCGVIEPGFPSWAVAAEAQQSLLVMRTCYVSLQRAVDLPLRPSAVVLVEEPGRLTRSIDVEGALGVPVVATVPWHETVARAVDSGLLASRFPRKLNRALRAAA